MIRTPSCRSAGRKPLQACLRESVKFMDFVLAQVVKDASARSIDEKVEKAGEMLGFIAKLPSGIERDYYLKKTAEALDLDEGVLEAGNAEAGKAASSAAAAIGKAAWRQPGCRRPQGRGDPDPPDAEGRGDRAGSEGPDSAGGFHGSAASAGSRADFRSARRRRDGSMQRDACLRRR